MEDVGDGMAGQGNAAPVIIKRKKVVVAGGHHGGAWKVAYADFVTAMMAFFLLMWLLNATTENQRKGLADYFSPTVPVSRVSGGGDGVFGGDSVFTTESLARSGSGFGTGTADGPAPQGAVGPAAAAEAAALDAVAEMIGAGGESRTPDVLRRHIVTRVTDEGLIVELFDLDNAPLFSEGGAEPTPLAHDLAALLVEAFGLVVNDIAVQGHVRAYPLVLRDNPVWDLSAARAQAMRRLLEDGGLRPQRMARVAGFADRRPATDPADAARNNRLEVILLRQGRADGR